MTKTKARSEKLKVMKIVHAHTTTEQKVEHKGKPGREPKNGELAVKALEALKQLGGKATSPQLVKALHFEGESARDRARRLMDRLVVENKVKETKAEKEDEGVRKGQFVYELVEVAA